MHGHGMRTRTMKSPAVKSLAVVVVLLAAMTWAKARSTANVVEGPQYAATSSVVGGGGGSTPPIWGQALSDCHRWRSADALHGRRIDPELSRDLAHSGTPRLTRRSSYGGSRPFLSPKWPCINCTFISSQRENRAAGWPWSMRIPQVLTVEACPETLALPKSLVKDQGCHPSLRRRNVQRAA